MKDCPQEKSSLGPRAAGRGVKRQVVTTQQPDCWRETNTTTRLERAHHCFSPYLLSSDSDDDSRSSRSQAVGGGTSRQVTALEETYPMEQNEDSPMVADQDHLARYSLFSDADSDLGVLQVRIADRGGKPQYAEVQVEGVPARGVIDSGSDITIMGGELFRYVAMVARLRKSQFRKPDRVPRAYNERTFTLDGVIDLDITFNGVTMKTPIYIRATASEQLLLGEGVCRQLRIISYHPDVSDRKGKKWHTPPLQEPWIVERTRRSSLGSQQNYRTATGVTERSNLISMDPKNQPR